MMSQKSEYLQIRVTPAQKAHLQRIARAAGKDLSSYVLEKSLPSTSRRFAGLLALLSSESERRFALAELNDLLTEQSSAELSATVENADLRSADPLWANYVAAMVEQACSRAGVAPPTWARSVAPLDRPHFTVAMPALRPHLLRSSPVAFKRRNIFIDTSLGGRV